MELADWDLLAVVRGCSSTTTTTTSASQNLPPPTPQPTPNPPPSYHGGCEDLQDLYKPFFSNLKPSVPAPLDFGDGFVMREQLKLQQRPPQQQILFHQQPPQTQGPKESHQLIFGSGSNTSIITSQLQNQRNNTPHTQQRPKKRKNLQKKVCHLPVEGLSSDMWAWRKYGQKPIKGSPYPRGYYRCSSSKGCPARKQVERNRSNPKMFIITYTSEHNHPMPTHRNSLAGSTRQKPASGCGSPGNGSHPAASSSPSVGDSGNDEMEVFPPDMVLDDDFFSELDDMDGADVLLCDQIEPPFLGVGVDFLDQQNWESGLLHS